MGNSPSNYFTGPKSMACCRRYHDCSTDESDVGRTKVDNSVGKYDKPNAQKFYDDCRGKNGVWCPWDKKTGKNMSVSGKCRIGSKYVGKQYIDGTPVNSSSRDEDEDEGEVKPQWAATGTVGALKNIKTSKSEVADADDKRVVKECVEFLNKSI